MNNNRNDTTPFHEDPGSREAAGGSIATVAGQRGMGSDISAMDDSWIRIHRKILDHWVYRRPDYLSIWVYLIARANWKPTKAIVGGGLVIIERGEVLTSIKALAASTHTTPQVVRTFLRLAQEDAMISIKSNTAATIVKLLNYDRLQQAEKSEQHTVNTRSTHGQHAPNNIIRSIEVKKGRIDTITDTIDRGTNSRSRPASPDEVYGYFRDLGSTDVEAATFYDHFESNGWKVGGKAPMKDWKAAARNWARRSNTKTQGTHYAKRTKGERSLEAGTADSIRQLIGLDRPDRRGGDSALELARSNGRTVGASPAPEDRSVQAELLLGRTDVDRL